MRFVSAVLLVITVGCSSEEVEGPHGIRGVSAGNSYAYVVPLDEGVVVVDTGAEQDPAALKAVIADRPVLAVLITHSHDDHIGGAKALNALTFIGKDDIPTWKGERQHQGLVQRIAPDSAPVPMPDRVEGITDGFTFRTGTEQFVAVHLPGHTPGSTAWLYRNVLFGGDAVFGGDSITPAPFMFSDDDEQARESLNLLKNVEFDVLLDGHNGRTDNAKSKL